MSSPKKNDESKKDLLPEVTATIEWLAIAFILAFVFRAFVMEAYRIPTGSMADTLNGAHFRLRCPQCGYRYNYGFDNLKYGLPMDTVPPTDVRPYPSRCPNCGCYQQTGLRKDITNGDRILVLKCIYQLFEPQRWDVIVFKDPQGPQTNFIKRLIALPNETVEIIDGDIYINGLIQRKPPKVQNELWMPVYNNDYQPAEPNQPIFNEKKWSQPLVNSPDSNWKTDPNWPTRFVLDSSADQLNTLIYDTRRANDFSASYAYDDVDEYPAMPFCSDLMMRFYLTLQNAGSKLAVSLSKYASTYRAWLETDTTENSATIRIDMIRDANQTTLISEKIKLPDEINQIPCSFANVDHKLVFNFGDYEISYDLGRKPDDAGPRKKGAQPTVKIIAAGSVTLSHIAILRDIHYTRPPQASRASEGHPFTLKADEFFVLGDNSPDSADSRWWSQKGRANNDRFYRRGIVPREYLVGKALFVYWPGGFRPFKKLNIAFVPDLGKLKFVCGGADKEF